MLGIGASMEKVDWWLARTGSERIWGKVKKDC